MPIYGGGNQRLKVKWEDVWAESCTDALEVIDSTYAMLMVLERMESGIKFGMNKIVIFSGSHR